MAEKNLSGAYSLRTPDDARALYRDWAETYDTGFAAEHGYDVPRVLAEVFRREGGHGPVLDIGAGTGLVGEALGPMDVDAIDISPEMLAVAGEKGLYRERIVADLTGPLDLPDAIYTGLVSAGTFTHGHVGAGCLAELMRIAASNALFVLSIKEEAFDEAGFGSAFAGLVADGAITPIRFERHRNYRDADHDHADDTSLFAIFRRK